MLYHLLMLKLFHYKEGLIMELSQEQIQELLRLKTLVDSDDIRYKEIIKKTLIENELLIYLLNNKDLQDAEADPSDYLGINILPYYIIDPTQHNVQNFICYETETRELERYNSKMKMQRIIFYVLCEEKNNIEKKTGIARHDLIAALLIDMFNWTNLFTNNIHIVSDIPSVVDNDYACRTLIFETTTDNNLAKTKNGVTSMLNRNVYASKSEN